MAKRCKKCYEPFEPEIGGVYIFTLSGECLCPYCGATLHAKDSSGDKVVILRYSRSMFGSCQSCHKYLRNTHHHWLVRAVESEQTGFVCAQELAPAGV